MTLSNQILLCLVILMPLASLAINEKALDSNLRSRDLGLALEEEEELYSPTELDSYDITSEDDIDESPSRSDTLDEEEEEAPRVLPTRKASEGGKSLGGFGSLFKILSKTGANAAKKFGKKGAGAAKNFAKKGVGNAKNFAKKGAGIGKTIAQEALSSMLESTSAAAEAPEEGVPARNSPTEEGLTNLGLNYNGIPLALWNSN